MISDVHLAPTVGDSEEIVRFIFSKSHFNATKAKWGAFEPSNGEVSVFRTENVTEVEKKQIGDWVEQKRNSKSASPQSLKAWVSFQALSVRTLEYPDLNKMKLDIIYEPTNHNHHSNIKDLSKANNEDWLEEAKILASKMSMTLFKL